MIFYLSSHASSARSCYEMKESRAVPPTTALGVVILVGSGFAGGIWGYQAFVLAKVEFNVFVCFCLY